MALSIGGGMEFGGGITITDPPPGPLAIGDAYGGGFYAGQISTSGNGIADYNLVVGPKASTNYYIRWSQNFTTIANASSDINGPLNTTNIYNAGQYGAAYVMEINTTGGFTDWYLPAKNELEVCYYNLKNYTYSNNTASGVNPNAIPPRASNYTAGTPAQTPATQFQAFGGSEFFVTFNGGYWSSTQSTVNAISYAWRQRFNDGYQIAGGGYTKLTYLYARAVRRVAV